MRVGTSKGREPKLSHLKDHPHACGDKSFADVSRSPTKGSSPCVWGQDCHGRLSSAHARIIPMRVGTSLAIIPPVLTKKDHPHACGDKRYLLVRHPSGQGSSPCVWGQVHSLIKSPHTIGSSPCVWGQALSNTNCRRFHRIIPMRVGTS